MYKDSEISATKVLIVKTSALGDIVQAFNVLDYLHNRFPNIQIDWVVEQSLVSLVRAHPLVHQAVALDIRGLKKSWKHLIATIRILRKKRYDLLFDLQGNCKSGVITLLSRSRVKVGFGWNSVRERPNLFFTRHHFDVPKSQNIRLQYVGLVQQYFNDSSLIEAGGVRFNIPLDEQEKVRQILSNPKLKSPMRVMVCPGSKWVNKQLPLETLSQFLAKIQTDYQASFLLMWGAEEERAFCTELQARFPSTSQVIDKLSLPTWQNLMNEVQLVIAVDSSALHLCGTTPIPSFSLFGPTSPNIFKPIGHRHYSLQGPCPYGRTFEKACPILRTCPTGSCIRSLSADAIYESFSGWWKTLSK
jgi:heptosyltransferase-1